MNRKFDQYVVNVVVLFSAVTFSSVEIKTNYPAGNSQI